MLKTITINKHSDLSEAQWKKYYDFRLLLDERVNTQTPFKSFSKLKEIMPNVFDDKGRLIIITEGEKFVAIIQLVRQVKMSFFNARLDVYFSSLLYDIPPKMVNVIKKNHPILKITKLMGFRFQGNSISYKLGF